MIEGAEILSKKEIMELTEPFWVQIFPLLYLFAISAVVFGLFALARKHDMRKFALLLVLLYIVGIACKTPLNHMIEQNFSVSVPTGRYQYHIAYNDDMDLDALSEKYKIVQVGGTVWIIEEKEQTNE